MPDTTIRVHWRPGCGFCASLLRGLERTGLQFDRVNIWEDESAAAFVRGVTGGSETVPTVSVGSVALVNPSVRDVLRVVASQAPEQLPADDDPSGPSLSARTVGRLRRDMARGETNEGHRVMMVGDGINVRSHARTKRNLVLALAFNGLGVSAAATGFVHPVWALAAMVASVVAVLVISFGRRLLGRGRGEPQANPAGSFTTHRGHERHLERVDDQRQRVLTPVKGLAGGPVGEAAAWRRSWVETADGEGCP